MKGELPATGRRSCRKRWPRAPRHGLAGFARLVAGRLNVLGPKLAELLGGSADLTGSVTTPAKDSVDLTSDNFVANYVYYGVARIRHDGPS